MYKQITPIERHFIATANRNRLSYRKIAKALNRSPSTISREISRNRSSQGTYTFSKAQEKTSGRRKRSRMKPQFNKLEFSKVLFLLKNKHWTPEQISNMLKKSGELNISHETIYKYIWRNKRQGGKWYKLLRQSSKLRRKRYRTYDSRGVLSGKRPIEDRPAGATNRSRIGHFEIDTVWGKGSQHSIVTLVDRKTGMLFMRKIKNRTTKETNKAIKEILNQEGNKIKTITADNGTEFHRYKEIEKLFKVKFYFAKAYHSWERGTNENTNGLIRQFLPKGKSMKFLTKKRCLWIESIINERPRKRHNYITPKELYV